MQKISSAWAQTSRASLVIRTPENSRDRNHSLPQNFSLAVHIRQEHVECADPLFKTARDLIPFIVCKNLRQQIAEPGVVVFAGRQLERDPKFSKCRVQPFFEFPQVGGCRSFKLADKFHVLGARFSSTLPQHFVPAFLWAIAVLF